MREGKTREQLEELLITPLTKIKRSGKKNDQLKHYLFSNHKMLEGNVQSWINDPRGELPEVQWETLYLIARYAHAITENDLIDPDSFFTKVEAERAKVYQGTISEDAISLPFAFNQATELEFGCYLTSISVSDLAKMSSTLLNYNFNIQREATNIKRNGETIQVATLVRQNVLEMKQHLKEGTLFPTSIVINAVIGSSDDEEELTYNSQTGELNINQGTILDIVDGFHRCKASELAINENPDIDFRFAVLLLNMTDSQAANYQAQLAKSTPISKHKQTQLESSRRADEVVNFLMQSSELKDKVSMRNRLSHSSGELISYGALADVIHNNFELSRNIDVYRVGNYLKEMIDWLFGIYEEEFVTDISGKSRKTVLNASVTIESLVGLSSYMYTNNYEAKDIIEVIEQIDFSRKNKLWQDMGVLNQQEQLIDTSRKNKENFKDFLQEKLLDLNININ